MTFSQPPIPRQLPKLSIKELRRAFMTVLDHAERLGIDEIEIEAEDFYWVYGDDRFDMTREPEPMVGSLVDDMTELKKLTDDPYRASGVDLERIAAVLRLVSDRMSQP